MVTFGADWCSVMMVGVHEIDRKKAEANMLRTVLALLVSGAFTFGGMAPASAQEQTTVTPPRTAAPTLNRPLAPGGAAGIKQAQAQRNGIRNFIPLGIVTGLAILVVVTGGDDDNSAAPTTTN